MRIVPSRSGDGQAHLDHSFLLTITSHLLSILIINQHIYRSGVAEQHLLCSSSLLLQAHLTVAFVYLK